MCVCVCVLGPPPPPKMVGFSSRGISRNPNRARTSAASRRHERWRTAQRPPGSQFANRLRAEGGGAQNWILCVLPSSSSSFVVDFLFFPFLSSRIWGHLSSPILWRGTPPKESANSFPHGHSSGCSTHGTLEPAVGHGPSLKLRYLEHPKLPSLTCDLKLVLASKENIHGPYEFHLLKTIF